MKVIHGAKAVLYVDGKKVCDLKSFSYDPNPRRPLLQRLKMRFFDLINRLTGVTVIAGRIDAFDAGAWAVSWRLRWRLLKVQYQYDFSDDISKPHYYFILGNRKELFGEFVESAFK